MTNKETYCLWAATQASMPIFLRPWWLDAVCAGKDWDAIIVRDGAQAEAGTIDELNHIVAAMPYLIRKRLWYRFILMPQETQLGGVWLNEQIAKPDTARIAEEVNRQLESLGLEYYYQHYVPGSPIPTEMRELGYQTQERITYRIEDTSDMDTIVRRFSKNKVRQLQKAERAELTVDLGLEAEEFYRGHKRCLHAQKRKISYSREFLLVLERKSSRSHQSQFIGIRTREGELAAAAYLVWDKHSLYYLIPYHDPKHKDKGASAMLVREAIRLAHEKGLIFDFEGSMNPGIARHYRQFGGEPRIYCSVERSRGLLFRLILKIHQWLTHRRYKI